MSTSTDLLAHEDLPDLVDDERVDSTFGKQQAKRHGVLLTLLTETVLDIKAFHESIGNAPVFTRELLGNAVRQLQLAAQAEDVEFIDCHGVRTIVSTKQNVAQGKIPELVYNSHHELAQSDQYHWPQPLPSAIQYLAQEIVVEIKERSERATFPVQIRFGSAVTRKACNLDTTIEQLGIEMTLWDDSIEHNVLLKSLSMMAASDATPVTNIVCIALRCLENAQSIMQHVVAHSIAQELTRLYEDHGKPLKAAITIIAQDPACGENDKLLLSRFPIPIRIVNDPEGFLAVNESSLVMSCYPSAPIKQIIADLAADSLSRGPAALLWNESSWDARHGGVDTVTLSGLEWASADPSSRRVEDMLKGYKKVMDGAEAFGDRFDKAVDKQDLDPNCNESQTEVVEELVQCTTGLSVQEDDTGKAAQEKDITSPGDYGTATHHTGPETTVTDEPESKADGEDEDKDITKGVPGFSWLKDMELWARLE